MADPRVWAGGGPRLPVPPGPLAESGGVLLGAAILQNGSSMVKWRRLSVWRPGDFNSLPQLLSAA